MKKLLGLSLFFAMIATQAAAHPTGVAFSSRGECQSAYAHYSKSDRVRLSELLGVSPGEIQRQIPGLYTCQYDNEEDAWFIVYIGP